MYSFIMKRNGIGFSDGILKFSNILWSDLFIHDGCLFFDSKSIHETWRIFGKNDISLILYHIMNLNCFENVFF